MPGQSPPANQPSSAREIAGAAEKLQQAERCDDRRQRQRHGEQAQDKAAAEKCRMAGQSACQHHGRNDRQQRGKARPARP